MKNKSLIFILIIPVICLFIWNCFLWYDKDSGDEIKVAIRGYDPRDLLSGHYIRYTIDWDKTNLAQFNNYPFTKQDFVDSLNKNSLKFYISEQYAKRLEEILSQNGIFTFVVNGLKDKCFVEVVYSYKKGKHPIAKQLLVNGQDYREVLNN